MDIRSRVRKDLQGSYDNHTWSSWPRYLRSSAGNSGSLSGCVSRQIAYMWRTAFFNSTGLSAGLPGGVPVTGTTCRAPFATLTRSRNDAIGWLFSFVEFLSLKKWDKLRVFLVLKLGIAIGGSRIFYVGFLSFLHFLPSLMDGLLVLWDISLICSF